MQVDETLVETNFLTSDHTFVEMKKCSTKEAQAKRLMLKSCTLKDSQIHTQRWEVPFYLAPDFETNAGKIKLAYGAHGQNAMCLNVDGVDAHALFLDECASAETQTEFVMTASKGKHEWKNCASAGDDCACIGDLTFGSDTTKDYSNEISLQGYPGHKDTIECSGSALLSHALWAPDSTTEESAECQCRHDRFMDGEGDAEEATKNEEAA